MDFQCFAWAAIIPGNCPSRFPEIPMLAYALSHTLHLVAALLWVGGMGFA